MAWSHGSVTRRWAGRRGEDEMLVLSEIFGQNEHSTARAGLPPHRLADLHHEGGRTRHGDLTAAPADDNTRSAAPPAPVRCSRCSPTDPYSCSAVAAPTAIDPITRVAHTITISRSAPTAATAPSTASTASAVNGARSEARSIVRLNSARPAMNSAGPPSIVSAEDSDELSSGFSIARRTATAITITPSTISAWAWV